MKTYTLPCFTVQIVRDGAVKIEAENLKVQTAQDAANAVADIRTKDREHLVCIWLNARHKMIGQETISVGSLTASIAHPREIFKGAIVAGAAGIILAHNHPSGETDPSDEDIRLTSRVAQAGGILGIDLLDHLIVSESGCYSFKTAGRL